MRERTSDPVAASRIAHLESLSVAHEGRRRFIRERAKSRPRIRAGQQKNKHARVGAPLWRAGAQRARRTFPSPYGDAPTS